MKLHELRSGQSARVKSVAGSSRFVSRVTSIGLTEECCLTVLQNARKRPVLVHLRDSSVAFDRNDCDLIEVEVVG